MVEISQEQQINHLRDLSKSTGWLILEDRISEAIQGHRIALEADRNVEVSRTQGVIGALKFVLRQVEEVTGRVTNATK